MRIESLVKNKAKKYTNHDLLRAGYIPLDKSWIIRMGVLDIINGYDDIKKFLSEQDMLSDDLLALKRAYESWDTNRPINVGESGTLFRFLQFASWKLKLNKKFVLCGTLKKRNVIRNKNIINLSLDKLLKLDSGTSQWASASVLLGNKKKIKNKPYKLKATYEALGHWEKQRNKHIAWKPKYDETILRQTQTFLKLIKGRKVKFKPQQAEDYCFARVFDFISKKEGERKWPSLRNHESDRITEMEKMMGNAKLNKVINSRDHRAVQAIVMWSKINKVSVKIKHPDAVNKSWPQFWNFIKSVSI